MRPDRFSLAKAWIHEERSTPEEARATWDEMDQEFNENRKIFLASAESDKIKNMMNKKYGPGTMKYGSEISQPPARPDVIQMDAVNAWMRRNPAAEGGRMGFYKGMSADKAPQKIKLDTPKTLEPIGFTKKDKRPKYDKRNPDPNFKGKFVGGGLKQPVPVYQGSEKFADITEEAIKIRNAIIAENGNIANLQTLGDLADIKSAGKTNTKRVKAALAIAVDSFPEIANFKFITNRFKNIKGKNVKNLNMIVDAIKASQNSVPDEKLIHFLPDNMGFFYKASGKATEIGRLLKKNEKPIRGNITGKRKTYSASLTNKMYELNNNEIKYITDRITEETGKPFTSKDYSNLVDEVKDFRSGVGQAARIAKINEKV